VLLARPGQTFWDPGQTDRPPVCAPSPVDDARVPPSLHAFAAERFVPYGALASACPAEVDAYTAPERPLAASRAQLAAVWSRLADGIVIITLREAADRRARLAEELRLGGVVPENADRTLWYVADRPRADFPGNRGQFGCMRSHVAVTVEAERRGWKRWVVFEDDMIFLPDIAAGVLHNAADALDADPGIALLALGTSTRRCEDDEEDAALALGRTRGVYPIQTATGTSAYVGTPAFIKALRGVRDVYGDPAEMREAAEELGHPIPAADIVFFDTDTVRRHGRVVHVLPVVAGQSGASSIGYPRWMSLSAKLANRMKMDTMMRDAAYPEMRRVVRKAAATAAYGTLAAIVVASALVAAILAMRRRRPSTK